MTRILIAFELPDNLKHNDNNPNVSYQLRKTIRNKTLIYKNLPLPFMLTSVYFAFSVLILSTDLCDCVDFSFYDPYHKHITTRDLRVIKNNNLRKLLTKGPNYREPGTTNVSKVLIKIINALVNSKRVHYNHLKL